MIVMNTRKPLTVKYINNTIVVEKNTWQNYIANARLNTRQPLVLSSDSGRIGAQNYQRGR